MSGITQESFNKLKSEYLTYRTQSEETLKDYQKTIKTLREANDLLKRENHKVKMDSSSKDQSKEIKKLKEDKLILSKQLMELESEAIAYKDKPLDSFLYDLNKISSFNFALLNHSSSNISNANKQAIKDNLKNKNEEILILKNELVKKEKKMLDLIRKEREIDSKQNHLKFNKKINGILLYRNRSDQDLIKSVMIRNTKKYFNQNTINNVINTKLNKTPMKLSGKGKENITNQKTQGKKFENTKESCISPLKNQNFEMNYSLETEIDEEAIGALEKNISLEIKNILEEKRNFILQTMTYENFSFDILSFTGNSNNRTVNYQHQNTSNASCNNNNYNNNNSNSNGYTAVTSKSITQDIDAMLTKIKKRKCVVDSQKKQIEKVLCQYEVSMNN